MPEKEKEVAVSFVGGINECLSKCVPLVKVAPYKKKRKVIKKFEAFAGVEIDSPCQQCFLSIPLQKIHAIFKATDSCMFAKIHVDQRLCFELVFC